MIESPLTRQSNPGTQPLRSGKVPPISPSSYSRIRKGSSTQIGCSSSGTMPIYPFASRRARHPKLLTGTNQTRRKNASAELTTAGAYSSISSRSAKETCCSMPMSSFPSEQSALSTTVFSFSGSGAKCPRHASYFATAITSGISAFSDAAMFRWRRIRLIISASSTAWSETFAASAICGSCRLQSRRIAASLVGSNRKMMPREPARWRVAGLINTSVPGWKCSPALS